MQQMLQSSGLEQSAPHLTPREREVKELLLKGYSNAEIMDALDIALPTAKQHKGEVMRKLGVRTLSQLIELSKTTSK